MNPNTVNPDRLNPDRLNPDRLMKSLNDQCYLVDDGLAMALFLATQTGPDLARPLLLEGEPGVGKTAAAHALAAALGAPLVRLQCYEGITANEALYEWDYPRQLLAIRLAEASSDHSVDHFDSAELKTNLFTEEFLLERPLLRALRASQNGPAVLLIDEIDRADDQFEALLLEFLAESTITVPELATLSTLTPPVVILTSNRTRELHDALKRRCYYHWIDYPELERVIDIVRRQVPSANEALVRAAADFVQRSRMLDLDKTPGLAETIDWVRALERLDVHRLDRTSVLTGIGAIVKTPDDTAVLRAAVNDGTIGGPEVL